MAVSKLQREYTQAAEAMHHQRAELDAQLASAKAELAEVMPCHACLVLLDSPYSHHSTLFDVDTGLTKAAASSTHGRFQWCTTYPESSVLLTSQQNGVNLLHTGAGVAAAATWQAQQPVCRAECCQRRHSCSERSADLSERAGAGV